MYLKLLLLPLAAMLLTGLSGCNLVKKEPEEEEKKPVISFVNKDAVKSNGTDMTRGNVEFHSSRLTGLSLSSISPASPPVSSVSPRLQLGDSGIIKSRRDVQAAKPLALAPIVSDVTIGLNKGDTAMSVIDALARAYQLTVNVSNAQKARLTMLEIPNESHITVKNAEEGLEQILSPLGVKWQLMGSVVSIN
jgi:hypothetical protein